MQKQLIDPVRHIFLPPLLDHDPLFFVYLLKPYPRSLVDPCVDLLAQEHQSARNLAIRDRTPEH
jgi:hypothetical protein